MKEKTHIGAYGIIRRSNKNLLVLKIKGPHKGCWDLPGGKIKTGQRPEEALELRLKDQAGLEIEDTTFLHIYSDRLIIKKKKKGEKETKEYFQIGIFYEVRLKPKSKIKNTYGNESLGARWFTKKEIKDLPLTPFAKRELKLNG